MKRYTFLLLSLFLIPLSVSAGEDTDRICQNNIYGKQFEQIKVYYPDEKVSVGTVWKTIENQTYLTEGATMLYYVVNIVTDENLVKRSELYSYNCTSKKPKQLLFLSVNRDGTHYDIDVINGKYIVLHAGQGGIADSELYEVSVYDTKLSKRLFTIKNNKNLPEYATISGFVAGKNAWYLYFTETEFGQQNSALYQISKTTKKVTKL